MLNFVTISILSNWVKIPTVSFLNRNHLYVKSFVKKSELSMNNNKISQKKTNNSNYIYFIKNLFLEKNSVSANHKDFSNDSLRGFETKSGIQIIDFLNGKGDSPEWGSFLKIRYVNYIVNNITTKKIDSTFDRKDIYTYQHGIGEVNLAVEEAIHSMKVGGRRRVIIKNFSVQDILNGGPIPSSTGTRQELKRYLKNDSSGLNLIYDIELIEILTKKF